MTMPDQTPSMPPLPALLDAIGMYGAARASGSGPDTAESWQKVQAAIKSYAQAVADERVRADRLAATADARRYRQFFDSGLPITFEGVEYRSKADLDAAMDAARSTLSLGPQESGAR